MALIHAAKDLPLNFPAPKTSVSAHVEPGSLRLTDVSLHFQVREAPRWKPLVVCVYIHAVEGALMLFV